MSFSPILGNPKPQYEDSNGVPYVGMRLFFYIAGTSTKQDTVTDSGGLTTNSNPIVIDANGYPTGGVGIYGDDTFTYKIVAAPAGTDDPPTSSLWSLDDVYTTDNLRQDLASATSLTLGAYLIGVFISASNYVGRKLSAWIASRPYYASDFGVVFDGTDSGNNATYFQNAINTATAAGKKLILEEGILGLASSVTYTDYTWIEGASRSKTSIKALTGVSGVLIYPVAGSSVIGPIFKNFSINCNSIATYGLDVGLSGYTVLHYVLDEIQAADGTTGGIRIYNGRNGQTRGKIYANTVAGGSTSLYLKGCSSCDFEQLFIYDAAIPVHIEDCTECTFRSLYAFNDVGFLTTTSLVYIKNSYSNSFYDLHCEFQQSGGGYSHSQALFLEDTNSTTTDNVFYTPRLLGLGLNVNLLRIGNTASNYVYKTKLYNPEFIGIATGYYDIKLQKAADSVIERPIRKTTYYTLTVANPVVDWTGSTRTRYFNYNYEEPTKDSGTVQLAAGVYTVIFDATDSTGSTDGTTAVITGMTDTSDFPVGKFVTVSAGMPSTTTAYQILSKTSSTMTLATASTSAQAGVTVSLCLFPDTNYQILMTGYSNETFYITLQKPSGFKINSSNGASTAFVNWLASQVPT